MAFYANNVHPIPPDHGADDCDDQLPLISRVGRGIKGDSSRVRIADPDTCYETHLEGGYYDEADGMWHSEWVSENINGGELKYQYNLRPYTIPRTFTITFIYRRPGRCEWSWTTPAIPYIWSTNGQDGPNHDEPEHIVGSGVATLFIKTMHDPEWNERLHYPIDPDTGEPYPRDYFNAPEAEEAWSSTITFGFGGDIEVPDFDDIAKIIGITKGDIYDILQDNSITINGIDARNLIEYIDKCDRRDRDHFHKDLGFNQEGHDPNTFGPHPLTEKSYSSVKAYIDAGDQHLSDLINKPGGINTKIDNLYEIINDLVSSIYGASLEPSTEEPPKASGSKKLKLPDNTSIATGNINVFSGSTANYIRTRDGEVNNDIKAV